MQGMMAELGTAESNALHPTFHERKEKPEIPARCPPCGDPPGWQSQNIDPVSSLYRNYGGFILTYS